MLIRRSFILLPLLSVFLLGYAQIDHKSMFQAYLSGNLSYWGTTIDKLSAQKLDKELLAQLTNYEYGYIPYLQDKGDKRSKHYLEIFETHINQLEASGYSPSTIAVYRSGAAAYHYFLNKMTLATNGMNSFKLANKSAELDPQNPLALSLKGNVQFYCPPMFGGSKSEAIKYFEKAIAIFEQTNRTENNWNYIATLLCLAQAYEKIGNPQQAIKICQKILSKAPDYVQVRDVYYPSLLKKSK